MAAKHYDWQQNDDLDDAIRELLDPARPLPEGVHFEPASSELRWGTKIRAAFAVFFLGLSVFLAIWTWLERWTSSEPDWLRWAVVGVVFAIAGYLAMGAYDSWQVVRMIRGGTRRFGNFFTPEAYVQHGTEQTRVLQSAQIERFEEEFVSTEARGFYRTIAIVRDGEQLISVPVPGQGSTTKESVRVYESWRRRVRRAQRRS